ncbi:MAG: hypothetical protein LBJ31_11270 [Treponema sp.]|jgi:hypothetical protein|nr:hypothetical protein [Treponema sp.]
MVEMYFSLRFQSQLRQTRPRLLRNLERSIIESIESFGGTVHIENRLTTARFSEDSIGFWLDMLCVLENIKDALEKASSELYGHICVVGAGVPGDDVFPLMRSLPSDLWGTGIWVSPAVKPSLENYLDFEEPLSGAEFNPLVKGYTQVRSIREFDAPQNNGTDNSAKIRAYLKQSAFKNTVIVGDEFIGKHEGLREYCAEQIGAFPPLLIHFNQGENILAVLSDAFTPQIAALFDEAPRKKLELLCAGIFCERLRDELSDYLVKKGESFFAQLLDEYRSAAEKRRVQPVIILENIENADPLAQLLVSGRYFSLPVRERIYVYGTCSKMDVLEKWEQLFPRIIKFSPEKIPEPGIPEIPRDLWEVAYCCALFRSFYSGFLLQKLFEEEGKNLRMIQKAFSMLAALGIIGEQGEIKKRFIRQAERQLGGGCEKIKQAVCRRLLDWVGRGLLKPCFALLAALSSLGAEADDALALEAICGDIDSGAYSGIDRAARSGKFAKVVGVKREASLLSIVQTLKALVHGTSEKIHAAFARPLESDNVYPGFRARILSNQAAYYLSVEENAAAETAVKEAMLITQNENMGRGLAHAYRLFSLVEFAGHSLFDALDYFAFAVEHAEKSGDNGELAVSAYYAAGAHFIFGNLSKAQRLAAQAEEAALASGRPLWADRSCFLKGRLRFETGAYQDALDIFRTLETDSVSSIEADRDFKQTLAAWIYRTNMYLHNAKSHHEGGADAALFEVEAAFMAGEYRRTLELANALEEEARQGSERFLFIEQPDWRSGFAQCELFLFPMSDLWRRMIHTYRALAMCHIKTSDNFDRDKAIRDMQQVIREELPDTDPNDAFYYYCYYRVLKRSGAAEVDMNTAISIAFKRLQRRASRIDDNGTKRGFLSSHYWNGALAALAREHKLI